jgi:prevent-host-death family protein
MSNRWQLQQAKSRFSELVERALQHGPQIITHRGKEAVVVVSAKEFTMMSSPSKSLVEFFKTSPLRGTKLDLARSRCRSSNRI